MRIILTGSREWADPYIIRDYFDRLANQVGGDLKRVIIVHGAARGADRMGAALAARRGFTPEPHPANWERYGRRIAGFVRNAKMLDLGADACVAFKDRFDKTLRYGGTECMVELVKLNGIPFEVYDKTGLAWEG